MSRLIDAEQAVELLQSLGSRDCRREKGTIQDAIKMLSSAHYTPTVDAVPVVRCEDCVCHIFPDEDHAYCSNHLHETEADDFCSYGIRKDWEDESD